ncbi:MAG TPA: biotin carboxylase N-terminal domain-containing protein [Burkholderiaceae bacterium]|nr:biotin carboxylase N-terminal domain-containing protein [Burkholderiaceae bacterium]
MTFDTLLIANRGEIAIRVARSARALGLRTVAVYSDADAHAPHVRVCDDAVAIGGAAAAESYLRIDKLIEAARRSGAQAIHPGYGFLAESAAFAQAVGDAGLVFVGPGPGAIATMGDKSAARRKAAALGVPVLPGFDAAEGDDTPLETLARAAEKIGYPVMIKAAAGGGGRGMRRVRQAGEFEAMALSARSEAIAAFDDGRLLLERAVQAPRHVEIQVLADSHGHAIFLGERDCSVQRRHQKIIEEAPCPVLDPARRRAMGEAALRLVRAIDYAGAGTVEFLLDGAAFYFMEMNTRLQVEHPVTEALTGLDLVAWQLRIAQGEVLTLAQDDVLGSFEAGGHAIEVRLCAEEPAADFLPRSGRIERVELPVDVRVDHALASGLDVSPYYDSLLGKLIAHGPTRHAAVQQLASALDRTVVFGVPTNREFLAHVLRHPAFLSDEVSTAFIDRFFAGTESRTVASDDPRLACCHALAAYISTRVPAASFTWPAQLRGWRSSGVSTIGFRLGWGAADLNGTVNGVGGDAARVAWSAEGAAHEIGLGFERAPVAGAWNCAHVDGRRVAFFFHRAGDQLWLQAEGIDVEYVDRRLAPAGARQTSGDGMIVAPLHGRVVQLRVGAGERVAAGTALATLEAMKMEHALVARAAGTVRAVHVRAGEQVAAGRVMLEIELDRESA